MRDNATLDARILAHVRDSGHTSANTIWRALGGNRSAVLAAVRDLTERGRLPTSAPLNGMRYPVPALRKGAEPVPVLGTDPEPLGTGTEHASLSQL